MRLYIHYGLMLGMALLAGCDSGPMNSPDSAGSGAPAPAADHSATRASNTDAAESITVTSIDKDRYATFLEQNRGQIVLVDFWATWCPPCMEGFSETVRISREYRPQGLVVASIAFEDAGNEPQVIEFLKSQGGAFSHFMSAYGGSDGRSMDEFEISSGAIPTLKLYDRQGQLRRTFGDGTPFTHEEIEFAIRELIFEN